MSTTSEQEMDLTKSDPFKDVQLQLKYLGTNDSGQLK